jgi:enamine deaminase RidA (YjgF/YER057c/UK114 family)
MSRSRLNGQSAGQAAALVALSIAACGTAAGQQSAVAPPTPPAAATGATAAPPADVKFYGNPNSPISSGVLIPPGRASIWVSGTVPPVLKADAPAGSRERFGDTKTQAAGILKAIEGQLATHGLSMRDVVYLRAYLVPDPAKEHKIDVAGWNAAYGEVFNTAANPVKTARSTVGVTALVNADWLIEIEAFAVYPAGK